MKPSQRWVPSVDELPVLPVRPTYKEPSTRLFCRLQARITSAMTERGRRTAAKDDVFVGFRAPKKTLEWLKREARENDLTVSQVLRALVWKAGAGGLSLRDLGPTPDAARKTGAV